MSTINTNYTFYTQTDFLPWFLVPYIVLVALGFFNKIASFITRSPKFNFKVDDYDFLAKHGLQEEDGNGSYVNYSSDGLEFHGVVDNPTLKRGYELINIEHQALRNGVLGLHVDIAASKAVSSSSSSTSYNSQSGRDTFAHYRPKASRERSFEESRARAREAVAKINNRNRESTQAANHTSSSSRNTSLFNFMQRPSQNQYGDEEQAGLLGD